MIPIVSYDKLLEKIAEAFKYRTEKDKYVRAAGIIFAKDNNFTEEEILRGKDYFHYRSGDKIDFFCIGYETEDGQKWKFKPEIFSEIVEEFESRSKWEYSGSVELLLLNTKIDPRNSDCELDFSDSIPLDLKNANHDIQMTVEVLFEKILRLAQDIETDNPSKEISKKLVLEAVMKSVSDAPTKLLLKGFHEDVQKAKSFGTINLNK